MLQIFSLRLSSSQTSYPTSVYGILAIRDNIDPRRNYVFNLSRADAVTVQEQVIKTCSPPNIYTCFVYELVGCGTMTFNT
jgi:hypothetical protein